MGNLEKDSKLSDLTVAQIAFWLDVGYMVTSQLMLGIYAQYAIAAGGHEFTGSGSDIRLGVQAQYHPIAVGLLNPWVGLGIGYEMLSTSATFGNATVSAKGFEFANLQAGLDFRLGRFFGLGPFVGYSLGQYSSIDLGGYASGGQSSGKALHEWLMVGAQFSLTL
jgi:outer membrane protein W